MNCCFIIICNFHYACSPCLIMLAPLVSFCVLLLSRSACCSCRRTVREWREETVLANRSCVDAEGRSPRFQLAAPAPPPTVVAGFHLPATVTACLFDDRAGCEV